MMSPSDLVAANHSASTIALTVIIAVQDFSAVSICIIPLADTAGVPRLV